MQDGVGLGQVKNMLLHDSHSMTPVDANYVKYLYIYNYLHFVVLVFLVFRFLYVFLFV